MRRAGQQTSLTFLHILTLRYAGFSRLLVRETNATSTRRLVKIPNTRDQAQWEAEVPYSSALPVRPWSCGGRSTF
jgi:hypothetical protein